MLMQGRIAAAVLVLAYFANPISALKTPSSSRRVLLSTTAAASVASAATPAFAAKNRDDPSYESRKSVSEWKTFLTDYEYFVLRTGGTEPPNTSPLVKEKRQGAFRCVGCELQLFESAAKFESGTGWPSFASYVDGAVEVQSTNPITLAAIGTEVRCSKCGGHLGDVFLDGFLFPGTPAAVTGRRYCIDGTSLYFEPSDDPSARVRGESRAANYKAPADVELPSWLQPPTPKGAA